MALRFTGQIIISDRTAHTARLSSGRWAVWQVSWLPGWYMDRDAATIAMMLADAAAAGLHSGHRLWPRIESWAADLGLTAPDAIAKTAEPPAQIDSGIEPPDPEAAEP